MFFASWLGISYRGLFYFWRRLLGDDTYRHLEFHTFISGNSCGYESSSIKGGRLVSFVTLQLSQASPVLLRPCLISKHSLGSTAVGVSSAESLVIHVLSLLYKESGHTYLLIWLTKTSSDCDES